MQGVQVRLNRFILRSLQEEELRPGFWEVRWDPLPSRQENLFQLLGKAANRVGGVATPWQSGLVAWTAPRIQEGEVRGLSQAYRFTLRDGGALLLDPARVQEREVLSRLAQKKLEAGLKQVYGQSRRYQVEGNLILGGEIRSGNGWRIRKGSRLRARMDHTGQLVLEVEIVHRILPTLTLEAWLQGFPEPRRVRNTYENPPGRRQTWRFLRLEPELKPREVDLGGVSLFDYHAGKGRLSSEEQAGRVVRVADDSGAEFFHLTGLLEPVLTLEDLVELGLEAEAALALQIGPEERFSQAQKTARGIAERIFGVPRAEPVVAQAYLLPKPQLKAGRGQRIGKPADALRKGALKAQDATVGLLVVEGKPEWPQALRKSLQDMARASGVRLRLADPIAVARGDLRGLDLASSLDQLAQQEVAALLVQTPPLAWEERNRLKRASLQRTLPSQFFNPPLAEHKLDNILLGLASKLGWRMVGLEGEYPAEVAVGFDAGVDGSRSLRYGGAACAVTADGGLLSWILPEAQRGERIHEDVVWGMVQEVLLRFRRLAGRWPRHVLLLRDGKTQRQEFTLALEELARKEIGYDLVSVRKSSGGRVYPVEGGRLRDGLYVPLPEEEDKVSFLLLTAYPGEGRMKGTPRPLKVVHEEGPTPVEELARQIYHLSRLYPPSGYRFPSLPAPLHLADRLVREVGRVGLSSLHGLDREKLFFV